MDDRFKMRRLVSSLETLIHAQSIIFATPVTCVFIGTTTGYIAGWNILSAVADVLCNALIVGFISFYKCFQSVPQVLEALKIKSWPFAFCCYSHCTPLLAYCL